MTTSNLIIVADDYGLAPSYDAGIAAAVEARAVDAVSVMAVRDPDLAPLREAEVELGLHLELALDGGGLDAGGALAELDRQLEQFAALAGGPAAYVDSHHHRHAAPEIAEALGSAVARLGLPIRSVDADHRRMLRRLGALTPDRLVGRLSEGEPAVPAELEPLIARTGPPPPGVTEWLVHPGHRSPGGGSSYDAGREEDLQLLVELAGRPDLRALRAEHSVLGEPNDPRR